MDVRHLGSWYSALSAECRPGDVGDGKDCVGEVSVHVDEQSTSRCTVYVGCAGVPATSATDAGSGSHGHALEAKGKCSESVQWTR